MFSAGRVWIGLASALTLVSAEPGKCIGPAVPRLWVTLVFGEAYNTTQLVGVQSLSVKKYSQYLSLIHI